MLNTSFSLLKTQKHWYVIWSGLSSPTYNYFGQHPIFIPYSVFKVIHFCLSLFLLHIFAWISISHIADFGLHGTDRITYSIILCCGLNTDIHILAHKIINEIQNNHWNSLSLVFSVIISNCLFKLLFRYLINNIRSKFM